MSPDKDPMVPAEAPVTIVDGFCIFDAPVGTETFGPEDVEEALLADDRSLASEAFE